MTLKELAMQAIKVINDTPKPFEPKITLIIPGVWRKSNKRRLCDGGPVGDIVEETTNGLTVIFDAVDVLAWCVAKGVVNLIPYTLPSNNGLEPTEQPGITNQSLESADQADSKLAPITVIS